MSAISGAQLPDVVVEAAGTADSINLAVALVRAEGRLLLYGEPRAPTFPFDYGVLYEKQCAVLMSTPATYEADGYHAYRLATNHLARGDFDFDGLITHRLPIGEAARAYELSRSGDDGACQVVIELGS